MLGRFSYVGRSRATDREHVSHAEPLTATRGAFLIPVKKSYPMGENALQ